MTRRLAPILACSLALGGAVHAQPIDTSGAIACEVSGWAKDPDPKGTNVRAAPRADAPIIGRVAPMTRITKDEITGVMFDIVGSKDGWLLVRNGSNGGLTFDKAHQADGRGWISARLVGTGLRVSEFRAAPRDDAPVLARMNDDNWSWGPWSVEVLAVHACSGDYVEVTARPPGGKPLRGWSFKPCPLQLTTCN
jgi:hypothetical protein